LIESNIPEADFLHFQFDGYFFAHSRVGSISPSLYEPEIITELIPNSSTNLSTNLSTNPSTNFIPNLYEPIRTYTNLYEPIWTYMNLY